MHLIRRGHDRCTATFQHFDMGEPPPATGQRQRRIGPRRPDLHQGPEILLHSTASVTGTARKGTEASAGRSAPITSSSDA